MYINYNNNLLTFAFFDNFKIIFNKYYSLINFLFIIRNFFKKNIILINLLLENLEKN